MKKNRHIIKTVLPGSIAEELELEPGDELISINGQIIEDVFDYHYLVNDDYLEIVIRKSNQEEWELEIEKDYDEDLGVEFVSSLMDEYRSCRNNCIFCFIDQMPPGMRETLYFKDDDARLSFLQGNYITLTNMKQKDFDRVIKYHLSPINISVHATNPDVRRMMLHNRFAGEVMEKMQMLKDAGIEMNGQIVLCKGVNDGDELRRSLRDLMSLYPQMQSLSVVPVGLSKYRDGLYPLKPIEKEDAIAALEIIEEVQQEMFEQFGTHFVHASDEFYLLAERELPEEEQYDGYVQLENGVGMLRLLIEETKWALDELEGDERTHRISIATGKLASPYIRKIADSVAEKYPGIEIMVHPVVNHFFGEQITVSGLITGADLKKQLGGKDLGDVLLLPANMFRSGEEVFLDDVTRAELENALQVPVNIVKSDGQDLILALIQEERKLDGLLHSPYEL